MESTWSLDWGIWACRGGRASHSHTITWNLQVITLNLAMQEGLGFFFNVPHVFQALLSQGPGPAVKAVQHFPSACKGEANTDMSES